MWVYFWYELGIIPIKAGRDFQIRKPEVLLIPGEFLRGKTGYTIPTILVISGTTSVTEKNNNEFD